MNYTYYRRYRPTQKRSGFKAFFWLVVVLVFFSLGLRACISLFTSFSQDKKDEAVLSVYQGTAEILEWGQSEAESASDTELVLQGDQVSTGPNSRVKLTFYNGTEVYMDESSKLQISSFIVEEEAMVLDLIDGRVWVHHELQDEEEFELRIHTDVMNLSSVQGDYLVSNQANNEYVSVFTDQVAVDFVDRGAEDRVVETAVIQESEQSYIDDEKERALLARENVKLVEAAPSDLWQQSFVLMARGLESSTSEETGETEEISEEEEPVEEEEASDESTEEEVVVEEEETPVPSLSIAVTSPVSGSTIQKDAIAIEGTIVSGTASKVTVTWGSGQPYTLSGFQAGDSTFRYVADVDYANYAKGQNTYTIVAYDAEGKVSNTVTVVLTAEF